MIYLTPPPNSGLTRTHICPHETDRWTTLCGMTVTGWGVSVEQPSGDGAGLCSVCGSRAGETAQERRRRVEGR